MKLLKYAFSLTFIVFVFFPAHAQVPAPTLDDGKKLGIVLANRSASNSTKQFLYYAARMKDGYELYKADKFKAFEAIGLTYRADEEALMTEENYLSSASSHFATEIDGTNLGAMPIGTVLKFGSAMTLAWATGGITAPLLATATSTAGGMATDGLLGLVKWDKEQLADPDIQMLYTVTDMVNSEISGKTKLSEYLSGALDNRLQISDITKVDETVDYTLFETRNDIIGLEHKAYEFIAQAEEQLRRTSEVSSQLTELNKKVDDYIAQNEQDKKKVADAIAAKAQKEKDLKDMETGFYGMAVMGKLMGLNNEDIKRIESMGKLAKGLYIMQTTNFSTDTATSMGGWFMVIDFAIGFMSDTDGPTESEVIMEAIRNISKQIESMRVQIAYRLDEIDQKMAWEFRRQNDLLKAILQAEYGQTKELFNIRESIIQSRNFLQSQMAAYEKRRLDQAMSDCLALRPYEGNNEVLIALNTDKAASCLRTAALLGMAWSRDSNSVAPNLDGINDANGATFLNLSLYVPQLFKLQNPQRPELPNPLVWQMGTDLFLQVLMNNPEVIRKLTVSQVDEFLNEGLNIQKAYQEAFTEVVSYVSPVAYTVKFDWLLPILDNYEAAAKEYMAEMIQVAASSQLPLADSDLRLPDESQFDPGGGLGAEQIAAWKAGINWSLYDGDIYPIWGVEGAYPEYLNSPGNQVRRTSDWGRGSFPADAGKNYAVANATVKFCDGFQDSDINLDIAYGNTREVFLSIYFGNDLKTLRENGFPLDATILPLLPRSLL